MQADMDSVLHNTHMNNGWNFQVLMKCVILFLQVLTLWLQFPMAFTRFLMFISHKMEYYTAIKKNALESVLIRWMNLEPIIQNEVSQKEKDKYCTLTYACGI